MFHRLREAVQHRAGAEAEIAGAVAAARDTGYSWAVIGGMLGVSAQAAQQRYGKQAS